MIKIITSLFSLLLNLQLLNLEFKLNYKQKVIFFDKTTNFFRHHTNKMDNFASQVANLSLNESNDNEVSYQNVLIISIKLMV